VVVVVLLLLLVVQLVVVQLLLLDEICRWLCDTDWLICWYSMLLPTAVDIAMSELLLDDFVEDCTLWNSRIETKPAGGRWMENVKNSP